MTNPRLPVIGYANLFAEGTVTTDGQDAENALDWLPYDYWVSGAPDSHITVDLGEDRSADYLAIAAHDIGSKGGTVALESIIVNSDTTAFGVVSYSAGTGRTSLVDAGTITDIGDLEALVGVPLVDLTYLAVVGDLRVVDGGGVERQATHVMLDTVGSTRYVYAIQFAGDLTAHFTTGVPYELRNLVAAEVFSASPADNRVVFKLFTTTAAAIWRLRITGLTEPAKIGVLSVGSRLELERGNPAGYIPPPFALEDTIYNSESQSGQFLGRSIERSGIVGEISLKDMSETWARANMPAFIEHARTTPWFFAWSPLEHPEDVAFCWTLATPKMSYSRRGFMDCEVSYEGRLE
jgi:hypothetical protein